MSNQNFEIEKKPLEIPTGGLSLVFTDIEGSSVLWEQLGDRMSAVLERHNAILRHLSERHRGYEVKTEGDAFFLYFEEPESALDFCLEAQRCLHEEDWPAELTACTPAARSVDGNLRGLRVRMGIHHGKPIIKVDPTTGRIDLHGPVVNAAARVSDAAHGGQTLVSGRFWERVDKGRYPDLVRDSLGEHRLKGMEFTYQLQDVRPRELAGRSFPEPRTVKGVRHNLPQRPTSFVGREAELEDLGALLDQGHRLITVTGAGGSGKTRTTLRMAAARLDRYPGGVWFVPLMDVTTREGLIQATAGTLGLSLRSEGQEEQVGRELSQREPTLLVFDNFEQLAVEAADLLDAWSRRAPDIQMLVSSQVPLKLREEYVYSLEPLASPKEGDIDRLGADASALEDSPAVRLFLERARSASRSFDPNPEMLGDIARVCSKLDGIPLAIELAAARCHLLTPKQILERMPKRFALLKGAGKDKRKSTLLGAVQWSWDLLNSWEQSALVQSTVFTGGFTLEMAEAVIDVDDHDEAPLVMDIVQGLLERNLLRSWRPQSHPDEIRYDHYDSVRGFLMSYGDDIRSEARDRYRNHCLLTSVDQYNQRIRSQMKLSGTNYWTFISNIRDYMGFYDDLFDRFRSGLMDFEMLRIYTLIVGASIGHAGYVSESYAWCQRVMDVTPEEYPKLKTWEIVGLMSSMSVFLDTQADVIPRIQQYIDEARQEGDAEILRRALTALGYTGFKNIDRQTRRRLWEEALELAKSNAHDYDEAVLRVNLSGFAMNEGRLADAINLAQPVLNSSLGPDHVLLGQARIQLGLANFYAGDFQASCDLLREGIRVRLENHHAASLADPMSALAMAMWTLGDSDCRDALDQIRELQYPIGGPGGRSFAEEFRCDLAYDAGEQVDVHLAHIANDHIRERVSADASFLAGNIPSATASCCLWIEHLQKQVDINAGFYIWIVVPRCLSLVSPEAIRFDHFDKIVFSDGYPMFNRIRYLAASARLALAQGETEEFSSRIDDAVRTVSGLCVPKTSPLILWAVALNELRLEVESAQEQGRLPHVFRGYLPKHIPEPCRLKVWSSLDAEQQAEFSDGVVAQMSGR